MFRHSRYFPHAAETPSFSPSFPPSPRPQTGHKSKSQPCRAPRPGRRLPTAAMGPCPAPVLVLALLLQLGAVVNGECPPRTPILGRGWTGASPGGGQGQTGASPGLFWALLVVLCQQPRVGGHGWGPCSAVPPNSFCFSPARRSAAPGTDPGGLRGQAPPAAVHGLAAAGRAARLRGLPHRRAVGAERRALHRGDVSAGGAVPGCPRRWPGRGCGTPGGLPAPWWGVSL